MTTLNADQPQGAKKPLQPGHPCYCTKPGHVWHDDPSAGTWCGQPVHRLLASGKVAKTCQQCYDANERFRVEREIERDEEQALQIRLENERRWAKGKPPLELDAPEAEPAPEVVEADAVFTQEEYEAERQRVLDQAAARRSPRPIDYTSPDPRNPTYRSHFPGDARKNPLNELMGPTGFDEPF